MADLFNDAPEDLLRSNYKHFSIGFRASLLSCNQASDELFLKICYDILDFQQLKLSYLPKQHYYQNLEDTSNNTLIIDNIVKSVSYIYRSASLLKDNDLKTNVNSLSILSDNKVQLLVQAWTKQGKQLQTESIFHDLNIGKLLDMKWKLGMAVSSNDCKHLNSPYVTMVMTIADQSGTAKNHSVEMTLAQFKNFSSQLKEMSVLLDTV